MDQGVEVRAVYHKFMLYTGHGAEAERMPCPTRVERLHRRGKGERDMACVLPAARPWWNLDKAHMVALSWSHM